MLRVFLPCRSEFLRNCLRFLPACQSMFAWCQSIWVSRCELYPRLINACSNVFLVQSSCLITTNTITSSTAIIRTIWHDTKSCTYYIGMMERVWLHANFVARLDRNKPLDAMAANVIDFSTIVGSKWTHIKHAHVGIAPVRKPVSTSVKTNMSCMSWRRKLYLRERCVRSATFFDYTVGGEHNSDVCVPYWIRWESGTIAQMKVYPKVRTSIVDKS